MSKLKSMEISKQLDEKHIKSSNGLKLLKTVIKASKLKKQFGMGKTSLFKTISILFREYFKLYLKNEPGMFFCFL